MLVSGSSDSTLTQHNYLGEILVLIPGMLGANGCALWFYGAGPACYSLSLVVIFGGLLLGPLSAFLAAPLSSGLGGALSS